MLLICLCYKIIGPVPNYSLLITMLGNPKDALHLVVISSAISILATQPWISVLGCYLLRIKIN